MNLTDPDQLLTHAHIPHSDDIFYIPNFISQDEERLLLEKVRQKALTSSPNIQIYTAPKPKWVQLKNRRLQNWGGILSKNGSLISEPLPSFLQDPIDKLSCLSIFESPPNHCLVNEYEKGQGISPHQDGPAYYPTVATISLGSHCILNIYKYNEDKVISTEPILRILQEPKSLLIVKSKNYTDHLHGIEEVESDHVSSDSVSNWGLLNQQQEGTLRRQTRVSLTFRHVEKTIKIKWMR